MIEECVRSKQRLFWRRILCLWVLVDGRTEACSARGEVRVSLCVRGSVMCLHVCEALPCIYNVMGIPYDQRKERARDLSREREKVFCKSIRSRRSFTVVSPSKGHRPRRLSFSRALPYWPLLVIHPLHKQAGLPSDPGHAPSHHFFLQAIIRHYTTQLQRRKNKQKIYIYTRSHAQASKDSIDPIPEVYQA